MTDNLTIPPEAQELLDMCKRLAQWPDDEREVLNNIMLRVESRRDQRATFSKPAYGPLNIATDKRDFIWEALEEWFDQNWYIGIELTRLRRQMRTVTIPPKAFDTSDCTPDVVPLEVAGSTVMVSDIRDEDETTGEWRVAEGGG